MFDEEMNIVSSASGAKQVTGNNMWTTQVVNKFEVPQNGYLYVFSSNQSNYSVLVECIFSQDRV
jgi:hypothetical protein